MKNKIRILIGLSFLFLLGAMSSANPVIAGIYAVPNPTMYIRETADISPDPIDPASNYESFGSGINEHVMEGLVNYVGDSATQLEGILATSWTVRADGLQYNFTLRTGVTFHDGTPFNAYVMKYSLDRAIIMMDDWGPAWMIAYIKGGTVYEEKAFQIPPYDPYDVNVSDAKEYLDAGGVVVVDDTHIVINLDQPFAPFLTALAYRVGCAVSPKAVIENHPTVDNKNAEGFYYVPDETDNTSGMVPLDYWFSGLTDEEIRTKLNLAVDHNIKDSGVVPISGIYTDLKHEWMATHAVGTGPYELTELTPGAAGQVKFDKYVDWWGWAAGKGRDDSPDQILIKGVAEVETRVLDLLSGTADHIYVPTSHADEVIDINAWLTNQELKPVAGVTVLTGPTFTTNFLGMNFNDTLPTQYLTENKDVSTYNATHGNAGYPWAKWGPNHPYSLTENASQGNPFSCLVFRKAVALSFDYQTYIQQTSNGFGERLEGVIPNGMFAHHDQLIEDGYIPEFSPDTAKALFEQVGWKGTFWLFYNSGNLNRKAACLMLKNTIESYGIGLQVVVQEQTWTTYLSTVRAREPPIFNLGWLPDYADPDNYASPFTLSTGTYPYRMSYANPTVDDLVRDAAVSTSSTFRETSYKQLEELVAEDYAFVYIMQAQRFTVLGNWVAGYETSGSLNPMTSWHNTWNLYKQEPATTTTPTTTIPTTTTPPTTTTTTTTSAPGPGFELLAALSVLILVTIVARRRHR